MMVSILIRGPHGHGSA